MKTMYLISIFLILIGLGCDDNSKKENDGNDLIGIWELIQIEEQDENGKWTQIKSPKCLMGYSTMNLEFKNDGTFDGNTCRNKISGSYEINQSDDRINTNNVAGTKVNEEGWSYRYWNYLTTFESYSILSDTLTINGNKFKIIFKSSN